MNFILIGETDWYGPSTTRHAIHAYEDGQPLPLVGYETLKEAETAKGEQEEARDYSQARLDHNQAAHSRILTAEILDHNVDVSSSWEIVDRYLSFTDTYPIDWEGWAADGEEAQGALNDILEGESKALVFDEAAKETLLVKY